MKSRLNLLLVSFLAVGLTGCELRQAMYDKSRFKPYEGTSFFEDGRVARPAVEGTVARGQLKEDEHLYTGKIGGKHAESFPFALNQELLKRGQERFGIYCSVCHGPAGYGDGMIVQRGFPKPTSFHDPRLRAAPVGYFFDVMTNGFGRMFSYAAQVNESDRWAIAAYIRVLQRSQNATLADVPADKKGDLEGGVQ